MKRYLLPIALLTLLVSCGGNNQQNNQDASGKPITPSGNSQVSNGGGNASSNASTTSKKTAAEIGATDVKALDDFIAPVLKSLLGSNPVKSDGEHTPYNYSLIYNEYVESVNLNCAISMASKATTPEAAFALVDSAIGSKATKVRVASEYRTANNKLRYGTDYKFKLPDGEDFLITVETYAADYGSSTYGYETGELIASLEGYHYIIV